MRIADKMNFDQVNSSLGKNRSEMVELQNQAATQKKLNKPSDDPLAATRVLSARTEIGSGQQFLKSISQARAFLEYSEQSLAELAEIFVRAKELAISQSSDASASAETRTATAAEVDQLFDQTVQVGNRKLGDRFLFGGFKTTRAPFENDGNYVGDNGEIKIAIQKEAKVAMNIPGSRIFLGKDVKAPATAGPGPSHHFAQPVGPGEIAPERREEDRPVELRGPASLKTEQKPSASTSHSWKSKGVNVFNVLEDLTTSLRSNDKLGVQESLDRLDEALAQVVLARSQLGARVQTLTSASESLQKGQVDAKTLASNMEDADTFELVSELNKSESTLKASLTTSGKLIQPSLLDFLR